MQLVRTKLILLNQILVPSISPNTSTQLHQISSSVCWDDFNPEEIWATVAPRETQRVPKERHPQRSNSGGRLLDDNEPPHNRERRSFPGDRGSFGSSGGRWQRGLSIPAEDTRRQNSGMSNVEADNPDDLWDDPSSSGGVAAAADFSAFGGSLESGPKGRTGMDAFELEDMSKAAAAFEAELHGTHDNGDSEMEEQYSHAVDASRPLASSGTTIRSGSGDHVNVFEDFGDDEEEEAPAASEEEDVAIKSGNENSASSRLMKMIGVGGSGEAAASAAEDANKPNEVESKQDVEESEPIAPVPSNPWGAPASIPSNPWGDPVASNQSGGFGSMLGTQQAGGASAAVLQQREEEQRRRQMQEEEAKKRMELQARQQAEAQAQLQQDQQMRQQQQNQVELVLIERISNILENSWGRTDLVSILTTLHADDSRVIAILANPDALRALIARHPQRIALVRDPAMGAEMAALVLTNQQWQMQQARVQQAQAQQAREQEELQRRRALEEQQQRQRLEAIAREREAQERQMQLQKQQQQQAIVPGAPWFYADPQGNIQVRVILSSIHPILKLF
jgi:hypothetical protein